MDLIMAEIIYVLANEAMPGLIKIGRTQRDEQVRMSELYSTGVPFPFECLWAGEVENCAYIESIIHNAFGDQRVNPKREFFKLNADRVIPLLKELAIREITTDVEQALIKDVSKAEQEATKDYKRKRPKLNFEEMNIPIGSKLVYAKNENIVVEVVSAKKVMYEGEEYSLTSLTCKLMDKSNIQPTSYWIYNSKNLQDIYNDTYTDMAE